jgi:hypothetical protein
MSFQYLPPVPQPGAPVRANGGGGTQVIGYRSVLDARRSVGDAASTPSADYPDGYLGTINSRRSDRLLKNLQSRLTDRSYQRGVHKGDKVDPGDYVWRGAVNPMAGIEAQSRGEKWTQQGNPVEKLAHGGKVPALSPQEMLEVQQRLGVSDNSHTQTVNPQRRAQMAASLPRWR